MKNCCSRTWPDEYTLKIKAMAILNGYKSLVSFYVLNLEPPWTTIKCTQRMWGHMGEGKGGLGGGGEVGGFSLSLSLSMPWYWIFFIKGFHINQLAIVMFMNYEWQDTKKS